MSKIQGTVKWFSNKKGYGFVTPTSEDSPTTEDIFVHQSGVVSEGYRTLGEGWIVEFEIVNDSDGKLKADNVTAPGGGPCTGPRNRNQRARKGKKEGGEGGGDGDSDGNDGAVAEGNVKTPKQPKWHDNLIAEVKSSMDAKSMRYTTGTIDIAVATGARIKLGTGGYTSMAHSDGILAEGLFTCDENGIISLQWEHAMQFDNTNSVWSPIGCESLVNSIDLTKDEVGPVEIDETAESLWGEGKTDPKADLEVNGFQMRRVVLTTPRAARARQNRKRGGNNTN